MTLTLLLILQSITLLAVVYLLLRRPAPPVQDPRLTQLLDTLPTQLTRLDTRSESLDANLRTSLAQLRTDLADEARRTREAATTDFTSLRTEITTNIAELSQLLQTGLTGFRNDNKSSDDLLRAAVLDQLNGLSQRLASFTGETTLQHTSLRESLNTKLTDLTTSNTAHQNQLRTAVEARLDALNTTNAAKLEEMRLTVDEKLHATLHTRLTDAFGTVTDQLNKVHTGLGEMKDLATGVGDLKKVLSNVSRRGGVGEFLVAQQLEQMFSPEQYLKQVNIKPENGETVDFALKFPNGETGSFVLLPIDSKFPTSDWERLEAAYDRGSAEEIAAAGKAFERSIRTQGKSICDKYIDPPTTMPHAIMVLPTESLYAEVVRRPGLQNDIQQNCHVTIAGPSTFMAILTSFQMGFHTLDIQKKGDEVWRVLSRVRNEFEKFGALMDKVEKNVGTVQKTLRDIKSKTTTLNRSLKNVAFIESPPSNVLAFDEIDSVRPSIAAEEEEGG